MKELLPPSWMCASLERICPEHLKDEIEGDFTENYAYQLKKKGPFAAKKQALLFIIMSLPKLLYQRKYNNSNNTDMLRNYIIIAIRNIKRRVGYSLINILGLAVGLACCMLIGIYVLHELNYDKFHEKADRLYRINSVFTSPKRSFKTYMTPSALLPNMQREFSEVGKGVRILNPSFRSQVVQKGTMTYQEDKFAYSDSSFFEIFSFELLQGDEKNCLVKPNSLVISESIAQKYFDKQNPVGELLKVNGTDYEITAIMRDMPNNSHIDFNLIASFTSLSAAKNEIWGSANYATYFELQEGANHKQIESEVSKFVQEKIGQMLGDASLTYDIVPISDIHLRSDIPNEIQPQNNISYIRIISIIGILILLIACINYMNLATARSAERSKEVGMRKVLGAIRHQIFYQFMGESIIMVLFSIILAFILVNMVLPIFNQIAGKELLISDVFQPTMLIGVLLVFIVVSFLAGTYPAIQLASFLPSRVLKGKISKSKSGILTRQGLVIVQFSISIFLIIGTLVIYKQLNYVQNKKLGYTKENVMVLSMNKAVRNNFESIKAELEQRTDVIGFSGASESPVDIGGGYSITIPGITESAVNVNGLSVDWSFTETMNMKLTEGRNFNQTDLKLVTESESDSEQYNFIINQALVDQLLIEKNDLIGRKASMNGRNGEIIGVLEDFHFTSLHSKINPLVMFLEPSQFNKIFIRVNSSDLQSTMLGIEDVWRKLSPDSPFIFQFLDDEYDALYRNEQRLSKVFTAFAVLAIIIASLGLFGLVSFTVEQRNKEIGIRKVLGASIFNLLMLITNDFSKLVIIAFIITGPVAYYIMNNWLTDFEYRISIGLVPLLLSLTGAVLIAFITVSFQSIRAASNNPVDTLRSE